MPIKIFFNFQFWREGAAAWQPPTPCVRPPHPWNSTSVQATIACFHTLSICHRLTIVSFDAICTIYAPSNKQEKNKEQAYYSISPATQSIILDSNCLFLPACTLWRIAASCIKLCANNKNTRICRISNLEYWQFVHCYLLTCLMSGTPTIFTLHSPSNRMQLKQHKTFLSGQPTKQLWNTIWR
jgi:hypothetical protein